MVGKRSDDDCIQLDEGCGLGCVGAGWVGAMWAMGGWVGISPHEAMRPASRASTALHCTAGRDALITKRKKSETPPGGWWMMDEPSLS